TGLWDLEHGGKRIAQVAVRDDADQTSVRHHGELLEAMPLHQLPRVPDRVPGLHAHDRLFHPAIESHRRLPPRKWRAGRTGPPSAERDTGLESFLGAWAPSHGIDGRGSARHTRREMRVCNRRWAEAP